MSTESNYYNEHAQAFFDNTYDIEMKNLYIPFLLHLTDGAVILDLGCGSGRDILAFKSLGYQVAAIDYSIELVKKARELTGIYVRHESFYELDENAKYDGVWACASLLHCERYRLREVIGKLIQALKPLGVLYMSFKYGNTDREKNGRTFTDLDEDYAQELLGQFTNVELLRQWVTLDQRSDHQEKWLNLLWKKHG
ncbi:hypothetical protein P256_01533 [Acinetobacter nectaris CIP 110549]|uniref:Methyltransferase domain-containing protein n=1 Tax=Acinetobacter nectaris CIP 110549 TaxID=1392540 RepID=V2UTP7_9GAMM|nr:class I SAM-dependent methyltransferase [Acinetobacter nectaris]ESK38714.1 hypothetical protein P256_01533 [Acinetobacter nectaris CIP 110549]